MQTLGIQLREYGVCLACCRAWVPTPLPQKPGVVALTHKPSTYQVEGGGSGVQGHPAILQKFQAILLHHTRLILSPKKKKKRCVGVCGTWASVIVSGEAGVLQAQCRDRKGSRQGQSEGGKERSSRGSLECSGV